jgi:hypothetical protein
MSLTCHQTSRIVKSELLPSVRTGLEQLQGGYSNKNSSTGVDKRYLVQNMKSIKG